ncbi:MAG TPA: asparagine synthase-related protein [Allosphingosinicella sp.]|jgi:asparagine synthase (glutamine-hydrolysing)
MTALAGYWDLGRGEEPLGACRRMLETQSIYGAVPLASRARGPIALGKRLYPTLPEDSFDEGVANGGNGRWSMVADVRLDDREGLAASLGLPGPQARRMSDAALVMAAVERWEEEAIGRLAGDFAIALWDSSRERLLLARDILGQRPLHCHRSGGFFAFASMPGGLLALEGLPSGPDEDALASFLAMMPPQGNRSFFRGVERVQPGELRIVSAGGAESRRHWAFSGRRLQLKRSEDYVEAVREALDRAVRSRLRGADGRIAAHLSGGLDSGAVAATAARLLPGGQVDAFTAVPGPTRFERHGRFADEGAHAAAVAALYPNMEHVLVRTAGRSPIAALDRNFDLYQAPVLNLCNFTWGEAIAEAARERGNKVLLIGQVGNFTLTHTGMDLLPGLLASGRLIRLARQALDLRRGGLRLESVAAQTLWPFLPPRLWRMINRLRGRRVGAGAGENSLLNPDLGEAMVKRLADGMARAGAGPSLGAGFRLAALAASEFGNFRQGALAGWGLDVRDPTGDRRLIEICLAIPSEVYLEGGIPRGLARRVLADRLPPLVVGEIRKGFQGADWHEGLLAHWDSVRSEVGRIAAAPGAPRLLDTARMIALAEAPTLRDWDSDEAHAHYRMALLKGISAGHFLRRAQGASGTEELL